MPDPTATCPAADAPVTVPKSWMQLGAKPKNLISSTPPHHEPWSVVGAHSRRGRRSSRAPPNYSIQLKNKYDLLDQNYFPPLPAESSPPSPLPLRGPHSSSPPIPHSAIHELSTHTKAVPHFTPVPWWVPALLSVCPFPSTPSPRVKSPLQSTPPPSSPKIDATFSISWPSLPPNYADNRGLHNQEHLFL